MSQVVERTVPHVHEIAVLSGPSFAAELARELPTAVVVASSTNGAVEHVQREFRSGALRLYGSADVVGVEIGGALKNIIAIAAGVGEGLGLGHNALAALITRGLAEIARLAVALGAQRETLAGLAGLGDLVLTCTGELSRNRHVGMELAHGRTVTDIVAGTRMVAEGVRTTRAAIELARQHGVELPIATQMGEVLEGRSDPRSAVYELMGRRQKQE
jgi:glycerol-3-phosphate dehydrogenase (NAD(P)+)